MSYCEEADHGPLVMFTTVPFDILWSIGQVGRNKPTDVAAAQVLLNLASKPDIPRLQVDGKWSAAALEALRIFQIKYMRLSRASLSIEPGSTTIRALIVAAIPNARMATRLPWGKARPMAESDYQDAARSLGCEVAAVKAIAAVESAGRGFLPSGRPKILFESHVFGRLTQHAYDHLFPDISTRHASHALYRGGEHEYQRLMKAMLLQRAPALKATSWGKFQILGEGCREAGLPDLESFVTGMCQSERAQLDAFCAFVRSKKLVDALKEHHWAVFAKGYNGPEYWKRHYDQRIKEEFEKAQTASGAQGTNRVVSP
jgi:hypothetical protein